VPQVPWHIILGKIGEHWQISQPDTCGPAPVAGFVRCVSLKTCPQNSPFASELSVSIRIKRAYTRYSTPYQHIAEWTRLTSSCLSEVCLLRTPTLKHTARGLPQNEHDWPNASGLFILISSNEPYTKQQALVIFPTHRRMGLVGQQWSEPSQLMQKNQNCLFHTAATTRHKCYIDFLICLIGQQ